MKTLMGCCPLSGSVSLLLDRGAANGGAGQTSSDSDGYPLRPADARSHHDIYTAAKLSQPCYRRGRQLPQSLHLGLPQHRTLVSRLPQSLHLRPLRPLYRRLARRQPQPRHRTLHPYHSPYGKGF